MRVAIALVAVYVVGLVVLYLAAFELAGVSLAVLIRRTEIHEPWRSEEWRRLAARFLGPELSPPAEEPPLCDAPSDASPQATNAEKLAKAITEEFQKRMAPHHFQFRWQKWYEILKARFPVQPNPAQALTSIYFSTMNSIGWAGLISAWLSPAHVTWHEAAVCRSVR